MTKDQDSPGSTTNETNAESLPAQIPLLDDVIFNTSLPFPKPKSRPKATAAADDNAPRATDLFGGSSETAQSGPLSPNYAADDIDARTQTARSSTDRVVDNLVAEYSVEIIERLRDELSAVLNDLKPESPISDQPEREPDPTEPPAKPS
jgi:hypothetical protein